MQSALSSPLVQCRQPVIRQHVVPCHGSPCLQPRFHRKSARLQVVPLASVQPFAVTSAAAAAPLAPISTGGTSSTVSGSESAQGQAPYTTHKWKWRGHTINYVTAGCGPPILLIHGFGASVGHFRKNIPVLVEQGYKVYALDLIGFGASAKPRIDYSMELFRDLVMDFRSEFIDAPVVLVGNSVGSLAALMVNAASPPGTIAGTVLFNSAGALNNKGVVGDIRILLIYPILLLIDFLLAIPAVSALLFNSFRGKDNVRQVLRQVYENVEAVDDALVDLIHGPSEDPGAREVFVSCITGPPGPKPWQLMRDVQGPLLVLWGEIDAFTPADGPVGKYFQQLPEKRPDTRFQFLKGVGHCMHDDRPEVVHAVLLPWLEQVRCGQQGSEPCPEVTSSSLDPNATVSLDGGAFVNVPEIVPPQGLSTL